MNSVYIYLAGPIVGCTDKEANDWREEFSESLYDLGFVGVSPLRCEPLIGGDIYEPEYEDNSFGTPDVIAAKNNLDVKRCDLTLAYMPRMSIGTLQEIGWAVGMRKPVILITDLLEVRNNAVIKATVPWRFMEHAGARDSGFRHALDVITGIFGVYAG